MTAVEAPTGTREEEHSRPDFERIVTTALLFASAMLFVMFCVRVLGDGWTTHFPKVYPDSYSFTTVANRGPLHPSFFWDERAIGYPLFLWVTGRSTALNALGLTLIYCAAYATLVVACLKAFTHRVAQAVAIFLILLTAVQLRFAQWSVQVLSETLALSTGVFMVAAWLVFVATPTTRRLKIAFAATVVWMLVRDAHVLPTALVLVPIVLVAGLLPTTPRQFRRLLLIGTAVLLGTCGYVYFSQSHSNRNITSFYDAVGGRILPDADLTKFFVDGGMPMNDALRSRTNHVAWDDGPQSFLDNPDLAEFRQWARTEGNRRLLMAMVVKSPHFLEVMGAEYPRVLNDDLTDYDSYHVSQRLPHRPLGDLSGPDSALSLRVWTFLALLGIAAAGSLGFGARRERKEVTAAIVGAAVFLGVLSEYHLRGTQRVCFVVAVLLAASAYFLSAQRDRSASRVVLAAAFGLPLVGVFMPDNLRLLVMFGPPLLAAIFFVTARGRVEWRGLRFALFGIAGIVLAFTEGYISYVGDSLEISRHAIGAIHRLAIMYPLCIAIGIDAAVRIFSSPQIVDEEVEGDQAEEPEPEPLLEEAP